MIRFLLPALFAFLFILESLFVELIPAELFNSDRILAPHFLMAGILFLTAYLSPKHGIIYGLIFGFLFDVVYTEIIGIYLFVFPFIAYLFANMIRVLQTNILVVSILSLAGIALLEIGVYQLMLLIKITDLDFSTYVKIRLVPTLILNLAFIILAAYPFKKQFEKASDRLRND
ncbi:rod shape-determining protein MreD [Mesobacillus subterraneus]|uniref:Rod shape-determining protein MreD n=1 Tax=Mesobacillus subterraneus TaxID=285983 RepID=A0A427TIT0_9BACI|nr:rod shape-determining protein MreD [Mesobacillus subterraneus]RSD23306.1 rod shape-determining protein MreD [Mesobacillus subterraneus]